jgi:hypothetical protein
MDIHDRTVNQLKQAAAIKERIETLNRELRGILGVSSDSAAPSTKKSTMSASVKRKIAATQKARWAKIRQAKVAMGSARPASNAKKMTLSRVTRAKLSRKLKAYWAARSNPAQSLSFDKSPGSAGGFSSNLRAVSLFSPIVPPPIAPSALSPTLDCYHALGDKTLYVDRRFGHEA